jgi:hypothetical protein
MTLEALARRIEQMEKDLETCPEYFKAELQARIAWKKRQLELLTPYHAK